MSDVIKHECGIALVRLLKPMQYYLDKYGSITYGLNKLYLLMEKQHNRGQDGAGVATIKLDVEPGKKYISRYRSNNQQPIKDIFQKINTRFETLQKEDPDKLNDADWLTKNVAFTGEVLLGHLRYGTFGGNSIEQCHPFLRQNNWRTRNLVVAGNFNLTNVDELFDLLVKIGQHPKGRADTVTVMEKIGHFLDMDNQDLFDKFKSQGMDNKEISGHIAKDLRLERILKRSAADWDGGYVIAGVIGHGDSFVVRDPNGIRPAYYYQDDEVLVVASERPAIRTAFDVQNGSVKELKPGHALLIRKNGKIKEAEIRKPQEKRSCSFERIYFSRGSDETIYKERKQLGKQVCGAILKAVKGDLENTVFSYIPNTAETAFYGMVEGMEEVLNEQKVKKIKAMKSRDPKKIEKILSARIRWEKVAIKDAKLRTFISEDKGREDLVSHVYDVTYGAVKKTDNLVIVDDSIVRGTTLKRSIIGILDRLKPKKIIIVSSAPQIRYPDCYGIDMAKLGDFVAFQAAIELLKDKKKDKLIKEVYEKCKEQEFHPKEQVENFVREIYKPFTARQISKKITELLTPKGINAKVEIMYQTIEGLHEACPDNLGDWYFTGDYPTPGGNRVVNRSFINYVEGRDERAY